MRKVVAGFAASLDGYIEGPNGEFDWILIDKEIDFAEQMKRFDTFFYGQRSACKGYHRIAIQPVKLIVLYGISNGKCILCPVLYNDGRQAGSLLRSGS